MGAGGISARHGSRAEAGVNSDGNVIAAIGVPTLDGPGGVGEGAHVAHGSIIIDELPSRAELLVRLIENL